MNRILPPKEWENEPCSLCAVKTALKLNIPPEYKHLFSEMVVPDGYILRKDGYAALNSMNKLVRFNLSVRKRIDYKRGERPLLKEYIPNNQERAIICVLGHYIYQEYDTYYSFFDNDNDEVVSVWILI